MGELIMDRPNRYEVAPGSNHMDEELFSQLLNLEIPSEGTETTSAPSSPDPQSTAMTPSYTEPQSDVMQFKTADEAADQAEIDDFTAWESMFTEPADETDDFAAWEDLFTKADATESFNSVDDFAHLHLAVPTGTGWLDDIEAHIDEQPDKDPGAERTAFLEAERDASDMIEEQFINAEVKRRRSRIGAAALSLLLIAAPVAGKLMDRGRTSRDARMTAVPEAVIAPPAVPEVEKTTTTMAPVAETTTTVAPVEETKTVSLNEIARQLMEEQAEADRLAKEKAEAEKALQEMAAAERAAVPQYLGDKYKLMEAASIPESDWYYVDCVIAGCEGVAAEGGWDGAQTWNYEGSGAYGICQAQPASKMASAGSDYMTNIVTQLKWCDSYAKGYGGWKQAWEFRKCTGYCYSPRTGTTVYKDHTWW